MIKVSEYASWSIRYYKRIIDGCLDAVGAPRDLVQFVVGYGETGSALVTSGVDKVVATLHWLALELSPFSTSLNSDPTLFARYPLICVYVRTGHFCGFTSCGCDGREDCCH